MFADFFLDGAWDYQVFENNLAFSEQDFIGRSLSASYAPKESAPVYEEYVSELKKLFAIHSRNGLLDMPNVTESYVGTV